MSKIKFSTLALLSVLFIAAACKHGHDEDEVKGFGSVEIEFDNQADGGPLSFGKDYTNAAGETLQLTTFNYYVSNLVLIKDDGTRFVLPKDQSYFLCKHEAPDTRLLTINDVPAGDYTGLEFVLGVDSAKSVAPIQERTGVLDPADGALGHYWSWNSGYIFMKMEGTSSVAPAPEQIFQYHVGLFGGFNSPTINNLKTIALTVPGEAAKVREDHGHKPHFHVYVDALEVFKSPHVLSIAANPFAHGNPFSATVADNYADMFEINHVHN